jgi:hypothetical protein
MHESYKYPIREAQVHLLEYSIRSFIRDWAFQMVDSDVIATKFQSQVKAQRPDVFTYGPGFT